MAKRQDNIETQASFFESTSAGEFLVSWQVNGSSYDQHGNRDDRYFQFNSTVIATIDEAEAFAAKLSKSISEAKAARDAAKASAETPTTEAA